MPLPPPAAASTGPSLPAARSALTRCFRLLRNRGHSSSPRPASGSAEGAPSSAGCSAGTGLCGWWCRCLCAPARVELLSAECMQVVPARQQGCHKEGPLESATKKQPALDFRNKRQAAGTCTTAAELLPHLQLRAGVVCCVHEGRQGAAWRQQPQTWPPHPPCPRPWEP